jgi:hypothetical protein
MREAAESQRMLSLEPALGWQTASIGDVGFAPLLAEGVRSWPDSVDLAALVTFLGLAFGLPAFGYVLMAIDVRRYLRSLRRALVVLTQSMSPSSPYWARRDRPPCLETFDLTLPCTEEQVLAAYRRKVKDLHPDKGGSLQKFLQLQRHFEQAMYIARANSKVRTVSVD